MPNQDDRADQAAGISGRAEEIERGHLDATRTFLLHCGYPGSGEDFFESLARHLAQSLGMDYVCIDRLEGDGLHARTVAVFNDGAFETNVTYALKDTPCGDVVGKTICCFPRDVCALFPNDAALQDLKAESYIGTTLWSYDGKPIGLIALIGRTPLANRGLADATLRLVAVRAAGELERRQAEEVLRESEERYHGLFRNATLGIFHSTFEGRFVAAALSGSGIRPVFDLPDDLPAVHADIDQVGRILENIAINAREAMASSGELTVSATQESIGDDEVAGLAPGRYLRVTIRDQGPGIAPEILPKIFDPYFSTKHRGSVKGMGLGLTISVAMVKKHHGAITVEPEPGKGAIFHIHLLAAAPDEPLSFPLSKSGLRP